MGIAVLLGLLGLALVAGGSKTKAAASTAPEGGNPPAARPPETSAAKPAGKVTPTRPAGKVTVLPTTVITARPPAAAAAAARAAPNEAQLAAQLAERGASTGVASPAGVVQAKPAAADLPRGYDERAARLKAQPTADHIRTRKGKYDRAVLASFQTMAGLKPDGLYGPQSRAALAFFGAKNVPAALFKGSQTTYRPPGG